jgi:DNA-directed RNA polymerase subunit RPC12/RpoP
MGRSVDYLSNAAFVTYIDRSEADAVSCQHCGSTNVDKTDEDEKEFADEDHDHLCNACKKTFEGHEPDADFEWECFEDSITELLKERCPSLEFPSKKNRRWDGRETSIIAENNLCEIGISEYCGLASLSIRVLQSDYLKSEALAEHWINKTWPGIQKKVVEYFPNSALRRIGGMSNGTGVYEKIKQS